MTTRYLLPCSCGKKLEVDTTQAGQQLECECGASVEVPSMRGIRALEPVVDETPPPPPKRAWSQTQGLMFAFGIGTAIIALLLSGLLYLVRSNLPNLAMTVDQEIVGDHGIIDGLTPEQTLERWTSFREEGLGERTPPEYVVNHRRANLLLTIVAAVATIGVLGLLCTIASFLVPSPKSES